MHVNLCGANIKLRLNANIRDFHKWWKQIKQRRRSQGEAENGSDRGEEVKLGRRKEEETRVLRGECHRQDSLGCRIHRVRRLQAEVRDMLCE